MDSYETDATPQLLVPLNPPRNELVARFSGSEVLKTTRQVGLRNVLLQIINRSFPTFKAEYIQSILLESIVTHLGLERDWEATTGLSYNEPLELVEYSSR